ncbi:hypothetical protein BUALT_BualtUnG0049900 [Buddleja alternifolia]|uniref:Uncharacterized protein n=1 Tax=Buddleja alternifolia TaxID=168488 RepID=A0AAV6W6Z7_9LAMI|nr:hypothetical protein BUALT_BualtUnG0049900 [Buddleja alternifolia]
MISQSQIHGTSSRGPCATSSIANPPTTIKKGRGPAQFPKIWGTKKLEVTLNREKKVIGPDAIPYKSALGCLARIGVKLPLNYAEFNHIPQYLRDMAWEEVEFNTTLPPEAKKVVLSDLNGIWRKWKHTIKEDYFLPHLDDEEYLSQLPSDCIELDQWLDLVEYWKDEDVQKIAAKNAKNVGMKECLHRTGRIPFTVLEQEFLMAGLDPTDLDIWMESRARGKALGMMKTQLNYMIRKRVALAAFASTTFQQPEDKEEMQKLKNEMIEEREKMEQMKDEFSCEKELLLIEKEKMSNLTKKLEKLLSQFPASSPMSHSGQVPDASSSHRPPTNRLNDSPDPPSHEEQIGTRVHLFCHRIPKSIVAQGVVVDLIGGEKKDRHVFVKVYVEKTLIPNEKLLRPYEGARTIGEAIHKCINWEFVDVMEI